MDRFVLTDAQWRGMEPHCLGKPTDPGRTGGDGRLFLEAVLWIARTGSPWRDLPPMFGNWNSVFARFRYWVKAGVFKRMFEAVSDEVICGDVTLDQELTLCLRSLDKNAVVKRQNSQAQLRLPALIDNLSGLALQMQRI
jgi:transposase